MAVENGDIGMLKSLGIKVENHIISGIFSLKHNAVYRLYSHQFPPQEASSNVVNSMECIKIELFTIDFVKSSI